MYTPPHAGSRSIVGPARLLAKVTRAIRPLVVNLGAPKAFLGRVSAQSPEGVLYDAEVKIVSFIEDGSPVIFMLDGVQVNRNVVEDGLNSAIAFAQEAGVVLRSPWDGHRSEKSLLELREELSNKIARHGLSVRDVLAHHGIQG